MSSPLQTYELSNMVQFHGATREGLHQMSQAITDLENTGTSLGTTGMQGAAGAALMAKVAEVKSGFAVVTAASEERNDKTRNVVFMIEDAVAQGAKFISGLIR